MQPADVVNHYKRRYDRIDTYVNLTVKEIHQQGGTITQFQKEVYRRKMMDYYHAWFLNIPTWCPPHLQHVASSECVRLLKVMDDRTIQRMREKWDHENHPVNRLRFQSFT